MIKLIVICGSIAALSIYFYGLVFKIIYMEKNHCQMTYMFEYPFYERIIFPENQHFIKYGLYAYSEGMHVEKIRSGIFNGAPVIFIPGNGGSYKQVRSLASVALRKSINISWKIELNYFAVDFNEELSGIFGGYLIEQKEFVKLCINTVLKLYKSNSEMKPKQVILIGHSMGGKIAQSLLDDNLIAKKINTIITISTPIDMPVIKIDSYLDSFYENTDKSLIQKRSILHLTNETNYCNKNSTVINSDEKILDKILFITIGGGNRDYLVYEGLTHSRFSDLHALTTSMPKVWLSTDHLCAVWCLELMLVINRFLFSVATSNTELTKTGHFKRETEFIQDKNFQLNKAKQFFLDSTLDSKYKPNDNDFQISTNSSEWIEDPRRNFIEEFPKGLKTSRVQMIRLLNNIQHQTLAIETVNVNVVDWIFGCSANEISGYERVCSKLFRISPNTTELLPFGKKEKYFFKLNLDEIRQNNPKWTHVILYIRQSKQPMKFSIDIHDSGERIITSEVPNWYRLDKNVILKQNTPIGATFYKILLKDLIETHQVINLKVEPLNCSIFSRFLILSKQCVPWTRGFEKIKYLNNENQFIMEIFPSLTKPNWYNLTENPVKIDLHLNPSCSYMISYKNSFGGMLSQIIQQHYHQLPSYSVAFLLFILQHQISKETNIEKIKNNSYLNLQIKSFLLVFIILFFVKLASWLISFSSSSFLSDTLLPQMTDNSIESFSLLINLLSCGSAFALILISSLCFWSINVIFIKILRFTSRWKFEIWQKFEKNISSIYFTLILVSLISCGAIALMFACILYFLLITKKCEKYQNENDTKNVIKKTKGSGIQATFNVSDREIRVQVTSFMLVSIVTALSSPSMISWFKNLTFTYTLIPDPSLRSAVFSLIPLIFLWELPIPKDLNVRHPLRCLINVCAIACILFCQESVFRLNMIINIVFLALSVTQLISTQID